MLSISFDVAIDWTLEFVAGRLACFVEQFMQRLLDYYTHMVTERLNPDTRIAACFQREHVERYAFASRHAHGLDVLDVACGIGYGSHLLGNCSRRVVGGDISVKTVMWAKSKFSRDAEFTVMNATSMPFSDASFDMVVSFETIEHLDDADEFLHECCRILRPNGVFVCSTPNKECPLRRQANPYHIREFNTSEFSALLGRHMHEVELYGQHLISHSDVVKSSLVQLGSEVIRLTHPRLQSWIRRVLTTHLLKDYASVLVDEDFLTLDGLASGQFKLQISRLGDIAKGMYPVKLLAVARVCRESEEWSSACAKVVLRSRGP